MFQNLADEKQEDYIEEQNEEIENKKKINLKDPIKEIGTFTIDVKLYEGIIGKLKINIIG